MTEYVLDASVALKWFRIADERHHLQAASLLARFTEGEIVIMAPDLLYLEVLNVAARRWRWERERLAELVAQLGALGLTRVEAPLDDVAAWCARGLSAYDAMYVSAAERLGVPLVTDDEPLQRIAPAVSVPLASFTA